MIHKFGILSNILLVIAKLSPVTKLETIM
jgi:hypothetical protein